MVKKRLAQGRKTFDSPEEASKHAESIAQKKNRVGVVFAEALSEMGFEGGRILDAGTGCGEVAIQLAQTFPVAEVVGLDVSPHYLELARSSARKAGLSQRLSFREGDVEMMPFEDGSFDVVVSLNTLHTLSHPVAMLDEIERVLAPHGLLLLSDLRRSWFKVFMPVLREALSAAEVEALLRSSRLRPWKLHKALLWFGIVVGEVGDYRPRGIGTPLFSLRA